MLDLIKQRFDAGTASQLDVAQQQSLVDQVRANIPLFDQDLRQNIAMLAVLIGRPPVQVVVKGGSLFRLTHPARDAGTAVGAAVPAPRHPRGRGQSRLRRCQRGIRARRVLPEHLS